MAAQIQCIHSSEHVWLENEIEKKRMVVIGERYYSPLAVCCFGWRWKAGGSWLLHQCDRQATDDQGDEQDMPRRVDGKSMNIYKYQDKHSRCREGPDGPDETSSSPTSSPTDRCRARWQF